MVKDLYFGLQIALCILAGCGAYDSWYRGDIAGAIAVIIIIACIMAIYSVLTAVAVAVTVAQTKKHERTGTREPTTRVIQSTKKRYTLADERASDRI